MVLLKDVTTKLRFSSVPAMECVTSVISESEFCSVISKNRAGVTTPTRSINYYYFVPTPTIDIEPTEIISPLPSAADFIF
jgi:hypothetical protein